jgi:hypothetical protein
MIYLNFLRKAPWWLFTLLAICISLSAEAYFRLGSNINAERSEALSEPAPSPIDLSEFNWKTDRSLANEVTLTGWIDWDNTVLLVDYKKSGEIKAERAAYYLFGAQDTGQSGQVRAIMLLEAAQDEYFMANEGKFLQGRPTNPDATLSYQFNGLAKRSAKLDALAIEALEDHGLIAAENVIYLEPFWDGRAAGLAPMTNLGFGRYVLHGLGVFVLLVSGIVFAVKRRKISASTEGFQLDPAKFAAQMNNVEPALEAPMKIGVIDDLKARFAASFQQRRAKMSNPKAWLGTVGTILLLSMVLVPKWVMITVPLGLALWIYANNETVQSRVNAVLRNLTGKTEPEPVLHRLKAQSSNPFR